MGKLIETRGGRLMTFATLKIQSIADVKQHLAQIVSGWAFPDHDP